MTDGENTATITEVARLLVEAESILFITGAGVSADSGLPTYRGVGGLYDRKETEDGVSIEAALSGRMFAAYPEVTWKYLWEIGAACIGAEPNSAHRWIAQLEAERPDVRVLTQNVDGLHRVAGSVNLVEVHGHAFDLFCTDCGEDYTAEDLLDNFRTKPELPPLCRECNGVVRPNVVLFEESLSPSVCESLERIDACDFDIVLAVGTSALFPYIVQPFVNACNRGQPTVEINPCETLISDLASLRLHIPAAKAADLISDACRRKP